MPSVLSPAIGHRRLSKPGKDGKGRTSVYVPPKEQEEVNTSRPGSAKTISDRHTNYKGGRTKSSQPASIIRALESAQHEIDAAHEEMFSSQRETEKDDFPSEPPSNFSRESYLPNKVRDQAPEEKIRMLDSFNRRIYQFSIFSYDGLVRLTFGRYERDLFDEDDDGTIVEKGELIIFVCKEAEEEKVECAHIHITDFFSPDIREFKIFPKVGGNEFPEEEAEYLLENLKEILERVR